MTQLHSEGRYEELFNMLDSYIDLEETDTLIQAQSRYYNCTDQIEKNKIDLVLSHLIQNHVNMTLISKSDNYIFDKNLQLLMYTDLEGKTRCIKNVTHFEVEVFRGHVSLHSFNPEAFDLGLLKSVKCENSMK